MMTQIPAEEQERWGGGMEGDIQQGGKEEKGEVKKGFDADVHGE